MCIAIAKKAGVAIQESILETCFNNNPDGAGFAVEEEDGTIMIDKGYFTFASFMDAFRPHEKKKALIHFRIQTHGPVNKNNCHPFKVTDDVVFIHNGIISDVPNHRTRSDTRMFKSLYLRPIVSKYGPSVLNTKILKKLIEKFIGYSKLAFMVKGQEGFTIFNEKMGNKSKEGIWFSNTSWQPPKPAVYQPPVPYTPRPPVYQGSHWSKQPLPKKELPMLKTAYGEFYSFGTLIKLKWDLVTLNGTIPKGTVGEVEAVYADFTADVEFYHAEGKHEGIKTWQLEEVKDSSTISKEEWEGWGYSA